MWQHALSKGNTKLFPINNPFIPNLFYLNNGAIEIWENLEGIQWYKDAVQEKNLADPSFFDTVLARYKALLNKLQPVFDKGYVASKQQLDPFIKYASEGASLFTIWYFTLINKKASRHLREKAQKLRDKDRYFDDVNKTLEQSIRKHFPSCKGFEVALFIEELKQPPKKEILQKRKKHCVFFPAKYHQAIKLEEFKKKHPEYIFKEEHVTEHHRNKGLKGTIAVKGHSRGSVSIVWAKEHIGAFKKGQVLVTHMTTPDYVPAMKRAAAIVTDEGGITSHAAIVSRELQVPCIIGTKVATKLFKNDDLIEVDANKGIVRRLS